MGTCKECGAEIFENTMGNLVELWCSGEHIIVDSTDLVYPVDIAPDEAYENDPNAYGVFINEDHHSATTNTLYNYDTMHLVLVGE
jgi:hypothetical protein